jgi:starch synthase
MVGSEAVPHAKTGGLADVLGALPRALGRLGHVVDVVMPRYKGCPLGIVEEAPRVRTIFAEAPEYFDRENLYGTAVGDYPDNAARFGFLARAAVAWAEEGDAYDVVHAHDWQAGLVPVLTSGSGVYASLASSIRRKIPSVFTIHNLAYQGLFEPGWVRPLDLPPDVMRMDAMEYWGKLSFLKGGITAARMITTVSPKYAEEIQTPEFGFGFDGILRARADDLVGILNGIDYDQWNPEHDVHLPEPFSASNLAGKLAAKRRVLETYRIEPTRESLERPLVGMISRLIDQKGFDLLALLQQELPGLDATFVVLGTGDSRYEEMWRSLSARHPDRIAARIGFDEPLAHLIEGGADVFLMPSRFEPCGLNQMYSLRYGTVPVVRDVGGLHDTVRNYDERTGTGTGFVFGPATPAALSAALRRALGVYRRRDDWTRIQQAGMREDHSWDAAAQQYVTVYERAMGTNH